MHRIDDLPILQPKLVLAGAFVPVLTAVETDLLPTPTSKLTLFVEPESIALAAGRGTPPQIGVTGQLAVA